MARFGRKSLGADLEGNKSAGGWGWQSKAFLGGFFFEGKKSMFFLIYVCWICILYIYIKMIRIMNMRMMMLKIQNPVITLMRIIMIQNMMVMQDQYHKNDDNNDSDNSGDNHNDHPSDSSCDPTLSPS